MYKSARALREELEAIYAAAEGRALTSSERGQIEGIMEVYEDTKRIEDRAAKLFGGSGEEFSGSADSRADFGGDDPGSVFIKSAGYKAISRADLRGQTWSSGPVEVGGPSLMLKGHPA